MPGSQEWSWRGSWAERIRSGRPPRRTSSLPRWANPGIYISCLGLRGLSVLLPSPAHAGAEDRGRSASARGSRDLGGRTSPARGPGSMEDTVAPAGPPKMWVRIRGPLSPPDLLPAPLRTRGVVARNFELAGGVRAADHLVRNAAAGSQVLPRVREPNFEHAIHTPPLFSLDFNTALLSH